MDGITLSGKREAPAGLWLEGPRLQGAFSRTPMSGRTHYDKTSMAKISPALPTLWLGGKLALPFLWGRSRKTWKPRHSSSQAARPGLSYLERGYRGGAPASIKAELIK